MSTSRSGKVRVGKARSRSARAGITFPVGRITRHLRNKVPHVRLGSAAPVYMAAVLEYLAVEVLDLAGQNARSNKRSRVKPRDIKIAVATDPELNKLCDNATFSEGGSLVNILPELVSSSSKKSGSAAFRTPKPKSRKVIKVKAKVKPHSRPVAAANSTMAAASGSASSMNRGGSGKSSLPVLSEGTLFLGQKLTVLMGNIIDVNTDAIVHPTDSHYSTSGQVGSILARVGGTQFSTALAALQGSGSLPSCGASMSDMFNIDAKKIIHCNSPSWNSSSGPDDLEKTIQNCLKLADKEHLKSIALPSVGSGNAGWPKQLAAETILRAINKYFQSVMASSIKNVYFVLFDKESVDVYTTELKRLIDNLTN